ncbi:MAG: hypothetical protein FWC55_08270 [Firmicutes bacterium]|nr:hypothetical protein [Bacillota bacterium]
MDIGRERLAAAVRRAVRRLPDTVVVERAARNEFGEPDRWEFVARLKGHFYVRKNAYISEVLTEAGSAKTNNTERFLTAADGDARKVREGDEFAIYGVRYKITDVGNGLDVYFDFSLARV